MTDSQISDETPFRYTAAMARDIELAWQDRWEEAGTFQAPNPAGPWAEPEKVAGRGKKLVVLDMFPYPSGAGLHVGHPLGYIGTDVYARYHRMLGMNVLHCLGYDAFGLPAEQYAVQTGQHPRKTTEDNMVVMRRQLRRLGLGFDERRSYATIDEDYFKWTQWIFLQIYNSWYDPEAVRPDGSHGAARPIETLVEAYASGRRPLPVELGGRAWADLSEAEQEAVLAEERLAYTSEAPVNWSPGLGTVLSNEEVTNEGRSERGNFPVFRRSLRQWMMRITAYADRLADDLDRVDWPEKVKIMQRNWIGRSSGARITFPVATASGGTSGIEVFTTRPDTVFGATFMVLAPEHPLLDEIVPAGWPEGTKPGWTGDAGDPRTAVDAYRQATSRKSEVERQMDEKTKTGVFTGAYATNPLTGRPIPVFVADYVLMGYGTGAIMAVPGQDERDWAYAVAYDLPIIRTVQPAAGHPEDEAYVGEGPAINSANDEISLDGLGVDDAKARIIEYLESQRSGHGTVNYRLRDWLFSRQRYWGEPFPIVYDEDGTAHALPVSMLPLALPEVPDYAPKTFDPEDADSSPEPPLSRVPDWVEVELDLGDGRGRRRYRRETNTMPNWAGSCWYYLRYLDPANHDTFCDPENERYWMARHAHTVDGAPPGVTDPGGVDLYIGGVEHAVLHLLYARFWHKVLFDLGLVSSEEPFRKYFSQGMIQALRLPRRPSGAGRGDRGRAARRGCRGDVELERRARHPGDRQDRQVPAQLGEPRRDVRRLRRRHLPRPRDVDGTAGAVEAVGDPGRRREPAVPATPVAQRGRRVDGFGGRQRRGAGCRDADRAAPHHRGGSRGLRAPEVQHGDRQADRAEQPAHQAGCRAPSRGGGVGGHGRARRTAHRRGAVAAAGPRGGCDLRPVPRGGAVPARRGDRHLRHPGQGQGPRPGRGAGDHRRGGAADPRPGPGEGASRSPRTGCGRSSCGRRDSSTWCRSDVATTDARLREALAFIG